MRRSTLTLLGLALAVSARASEVEPSLLALDLDELLQLKVTVQRRVENPDDVPIAITVLPGAQLARIGAAGDDQRMLSSRLPSLQVESSFGRAFPRFYIRGMGNTSFDVYASQPVSILHDDVQLESPVLKGFPLFDLEQVELARGPQGTLFGRNTPAGVLKFVSVQPTQDFEGFGRVGVGEHGTRNLEAAVGGGRASGWSARLSLLQQHRDDWVRNDFAGPEDGFEGYRDSALRLQLRYEGREGFEALARVHARDLDGTARMFRANIIEPGSNDFRRDFRRERVAQDGRNEQTVEHQGASLSLRWSLANLELHSITAYQTAEVFSRGDIDGGFGSASAPPSGPGFIPFSSETATAVPDYHQLTQELRLVSATDGRVDWQAGLFWFDERQTAENFNYSTAAGGEQNGYAVIHQDNQAAAAFASAGFALNERLQLRGGLRYTRDRKAFSAERPQTPGAGAPLLPLRASPEGTHLSWDASALWRLDEGLNAYLRLAEGFRAPSLQGRVMFSNEISQADSETVLSLEGGVKGEVLDRRLRFALGVYRYWLDHPQLTAVGGGGNQARLLNAARAEGRGAELDLEANWGEHTHLTAGLSYNHTAIRDPNLLIRVCGAPCTVIDPIEVVGGVRLARIDGNPLPYAPRWIAHFNLLHEVPFGGGRLYAQTDWAWRSDFEFFLYRSREFRASPLLEGGLRLGYRWQEGRRDLALFARNLTDETALIGAIDFNNLTGMLNEPRVVGLELRLGF